MAIQQFFKLQEKKLNNNLEVIINKIAKVYNISNKTYKIDRENIIISKFEYSKVMKAF